LVQLHFDFIPFYEFYRNLSEPKKFDSETQRLKFFCRRLNSAFCCFPIFVDDADVSLEMFQESFPCAEDGLLDPLYFALIDAIRNAASESFIATCGTSWELQNFNQYTWGIGEAAQVIVLAVSNRFETIKQMNHYLEGIFPSLTENQGTVFIGRVGFLCKFIEEYCFAKLSNGQEISVDRLIQVFLEKETLEMIFHRTRSFNETMLADLWQFVYRICFFEEAQKVYVLPRRAWIFEKGLGNLVREYYFKVMMDEPIVILAALNFLGKRQQEAMLLKDFFSCKLLSQLSSHSLYNADQQGLVLLSCLAILKSCSEDCSVLLKYFSRIFNNSGYLYRPSSTSLISNSANLSLIDFLEKRPTAFYLLNQHKGPDLVFHICLGQDNNLPVFIQTKAHKFGKLVSAMDTIRPDRFYCGTGSLSSRNLEKKKIEKFFVDRQYLAILFCFRSPVHQGQNNSQHDNRLELILDIDSLVDNEYKEILYELKNSIYFYL
jgi:hypothetical protein